MRLLSDVWTFSLNSDTCSTSFSLGTRWVLNEAECDWVDVWNGHLCFGRYDCRCPFQCCQHRLWNSQLFASSHLQSQGSGLPVCWWLCDRRARLWSPTFALVSVQTYHRSCPTELCSTGWACAAAGTSEPASAPRPPPPACCDWSAWQVSLQKLWCGLNPHSAHYWLPAAVWWQSKWRSPSWRGNTHVLTECLVCCYEHSAVTLPSIPHVFTVLSSFSVTLSVVGWLSDDSLCVCITADLPSHSSVMNEQDTVMYLWKGRAVQNSAVRATFSTLPSCTTSSSTFSWKCPSIRRVMSPVDGIL